MWCSDITYILMHKGFLYLGGGHGLAHAQGAVLASVEHDGCGVLRRGPECAGALRHTPEIFNTDQGSQFPTLPFTEVLERRQVRISMDGRGRWLDNALIERLWWPLKYECVYLHAFETGSELRARLAGWIAHYNG
ncbi:transposase [Komagataeibacter nataicola NRIC 0616]|nr:transposase [Komagataeibacter nataicola NRIC 0616]